MLDFGFSGVGNGGAPPTPEPPLWSVQPQYLMYEDFDKGALPFGWNSSTNGAGANVVYGNDYETFAIGQADLRADSNPVQLRRAGLLYSNGNNLILRLDDCVYTKWYSAIRRASTDIGLMQVGLSNVHNVNPSAFGNTIAVRHDPTNVSGENPLLITNFILITKKAGVGYQVYDTGVAPTDLWQYFDFEFNNQGTPTLTLKIDGVQVASITDLTNIPVNIVTGANVGLHPMAYVGQQTVLPANQNRLHLDKFSLFRKWS